MPRSLRFSDQTFPLASSGNRARIAGSATGAKSANGASTPPISDAFSPGLARKTIGALRAPESSSPRTNAVSRRYVPPRRTTSAPPDGRPPSCRLRSRIASRARSSVANGIWSVPSLPSAPSGATWKTKFEWGASSGLCADAQPLFANSAPNRTAAISAKACFIGSIPFARTALDCGRPCQPQAFSWALARPCFFSREPD
ncbi:MAG: hypothetical protein BWZ10_01596 [candidate division BRC1 bacterium ADurb.BinA364]|nr:MAG: hypothetical protein BWZ10_01596 [candidate division BRC1 bacterium ADurb.BinA364]